VRRVQLCIAVTLLAAPLVAFAAPKQGDPGDGLAVSPVLIDTSDGTGSTLGLEFALKGTLAQRNLDSDDFDFEHAKLGSFLLKYDVSGTATADADRNPKDFLNALLSASYQMTRTFGSLRAGGFAKYESDQSFDNHQSVYGLKATYVKLGIFQEADWVALDLSTGRVNPQGDTEREQALGTTDLRGYYRTDAEFVYRCTVGVSIIDTFEFNYRYFRESSPPAQVEAAGLDRHHLTTFYLGLPKDLFIAYSTGTLPFDRRSDRIFEVGLTFKLQ
jgi:hypothetical protein